MPRVTIYTQVYNAGKYLEPCISSVLNQTYPDFEYIVVDSASTDGSTEKLEAFAERDKRIHLIRLEKNQRSIQFEIVKQFAHGSYLACLDHDDWWEPDYLERLLAFLEDNALDLAMTGTIAHYEANRTQGVLRKLDSPVVLTLEQFVQYYPHFWAFSSTRWASLMPIELFLSLEDAYRENQLRRPDYGGDTLIMLKCLDKCRRIGIDNSTLYHYRIHKKSQTFQYSGGRFDANVACFEAFRSFLVRHGVLDAQKQEWLKRVHISSMLATLDLLADSSLSDEGKLRECARIAVHPLTAYVLDCSIPERQQWKEKMWNIFSTSAQRQCISDYRIWKDILYVLAPRCCAAVLENSLTLFKREPELLSLLLLDDRDALANKLFGFLSEKKYVKQYDIARMLCNIIPDASPLKLATDEKFFGRYANICQLIFAGQNLAALDQMTELLLSEKKIYDKEIFLQIYLTLAALESQIPSFLFGKIGLARLYLNAGRKSDCLSVIKELEEMGAGEHEEVAALRYAVEGTEG